MTPPVLARRYSAKNMDGIFLIPPAECKVLNGGGKKQKSGDNKKKSFGNKTWNRKADEATSSSKKDLAAFIQKSVAKGIRHEINKIDKKRSNSESSDEGEFDLNALEKDIQGFNYSEMDSLKIETDDDSVSCLKSRQGCACGTSGEVGR